MGTVGGRGRLLRRALLPACVALLLAGCSSMPSSGEVRKVGDGGQRADADSQVRVFSIAPSPGESPSDIVSGFLEATTSGETDFATAKKYLTKDEAAQWDPFAQITVLPDQPQSQEDITDSSRKDGYATVKLSGTLQAVVDTHHAYEPQQGPYSASVNLIKQDNQWRIDGLPDGLVLSQLDFQRIYHSANMYYFDKLGPDGQSTPGAEQTLVADPVYLRDQVDTLESTVSALLSGPSGWLSPVVTTAAPAGARLDTKAADHGVSLDDSQRLRVRLDHSGDKLSGQRCTQLAAQLFATVQAQASAQLDGRRGGPDGRFYRVCAGQRRRAAVPGGPAGRRLPAAVLHRRGQPAPAAGAARRPGQGDGVPGARAVRRGQGRPGLGGRLPRPAAGRGRTGRRPRTGGRLAHRRPAAGRARAEEHREQPQERAERAELGRARRSVGGRPRPGRAPAGGAAQRRGAGRSL